MSRSLGRRILGAVVALVAGLGTGCDDGGTEQGAAIPYQTFARVEMDLAQPQLERGFVYELRTLQHLDRLASLNILPDIQSASFYLKDAAYVGLLVVPLRNSATCCQYLSAVSAIEKRGSTLSLEMSSSEISGACGLNNCVIEYIPAELVVFKVMGLDTFDVRYDGETLPTRPLP